ncbi:hypothetical protein Hanom_Chr06g00546601 [Helianthus anomalus]
MRQHGIGHVTILCLFIPVFALVILLLSCDQIMETILDAPESATAVTDKHECAHWAWFKSCYNKCLNDVNPFCGDKFTNE